MRIKIDRLLPQKYGSQVLVVERLDNQNNASSNLCKALQERRENASPHRKLITEERKRLNKLDTIAGKLKRGENV